MKKNKFIFGFLLLIGLITGCGELDYENKEFFKQEVYVISSESQSASDRYVANIMAHTFIDSLVIINDSYESDTIWDTNVGHAQVKYKIGIGGSLPANEDIQVKIAFDQEILDDYNIEKNLHLYIPSPSEYTTNIPYNNADQTFTVMIPKGSSSSALIFDISIERDKADKGEYLKFGFPVKIVSCEQAPLSRQFTTFLTASLVVTSQKAVNWSGFPIPKLPEGRWHSTRLQGNGGENTANDIHRVHKYIMHLGDTPDLENQYMVWGTGVWSFEVFGFHGIGWMYNLLYLNDQVKGTYTLEPILQGNPNFPAKTFSYSTVQNVTENSKYDPKTKTLTLYYSNVIGQNYVDVMTFVDDSFIFTPVTPKSGITPTDWIEVRSKGYKYWLPIDSENNP